jgi:hypothetical protein
MTLRLKTCLFMAVLAAIACSQHNPDGPGAGDFTPPGVASVVAWDKYHVIVTFNERVSRETAESAVNYQLGAPSGPKPRPISIAGVDSAYGVYAAALHEDNLTVTLTTDSLSNSPYALRVVGVADLHGNAIPGKIEADFEGTNGADVTPPEIVLRSPQPDDTHASTGGFIVIGFSEAVPFDSFSKAFRVSGDGAQLVSVRNDDLLHYYCDLRELLPNTDYTVSLHGARDMAGNVMPETQWTFRTDKTADTAAPTVVSSRPATLAVNVDTGAQLSFSFSEPVDPYSLILRPHVNFDAAHWTNGGRKVTFETTWQPGQQYTIQIRPGEMRDLAGNRNPGLFTLVFSTGGELAQGTFSGSIGGDPASTSAKNASGALVFAGPTSPYDLYTSVAGTVGVAGAFELTHVAPGTYYPFCVLDSNHDGIYQPLFGDAVGIYGIIDWWSEQEAQSVTVVQGPVRGIGFRLYDPTAVYGLLAYDGSKVGQVHVGLFNTANFDPTTSVPVVSVIAQRTGASDYTINSLNTGPIPDGDYFVAAYLDAASNGVFDPADDPLGVYGGTTPIAIHVAGAADSPDVSISLQDPGSAIHANAVRWPDAPRSGRLDRFRAIETDTP